MIKFDLQKVEFDKWKADLDLQKIKFDLKNVKFVSKRVEIDLIRLVKSYMYRRFGTKSCVNIIIIIEIKKKRYEYYRK